MPRTWLERNIRLLAAAESVAAVVFAVVLASPSAGVVGRVEAAGEPLFPTMLEPGTVEDAGEPVAPTMLAPGLVVVEPLVAGEPVREITLPALSPVEPCAVVLADELGVVGAVATPAVPVTLVPVVAGVTVPAAPLVAAAPDVRISGKPCPVETGVRLLPTTLLFSGKT